MSERREPKKAYAVSWGSHSDYSVWAIFDTRQRAEQYLREEGYEPVLVQPETPLGRLSWETWRRRDASGEFVVGDIPDIEEFDYYDGDVLPLADAQP